MSVLENINLWLKSTGKIYTDDKDGMPYVKTDYKVGSYITTDNDKILDKERIVEPNGTGTTIISIDSTPPKRAKIIFNTDGNEVGYRTITDIQYHELLEKGRREPVELTQGMTR